MRRRISNKVVLGGKQTLREYTSVDLPLYFTRYNLGITEKLYFFNQV